MCVDIGNTRLTVRSIDQSALTNQRNVLVRPVVMRNANAELQAVAVVLHATVNQKPARRTRRRNAATD